MASDDKKTKAILAPKSETEVKKAVAEKKKDEVQPKDKNPSDVNSTKTDSPLGYSRGEGQKPVSKAYKDNWNAIYGKKKKR